MIEIFFKNKNKKQQIRLRRLSYAFYGAGIHTIVCYLLWTANFFRISGVEFSIAFSVIWLINITFFFAVYFGFNEKFKDPSLTIPLMFWAMSCLMYTVYLTAEVREILLMFNFFILVFGTFHLNMRQFVLVTTYGVFCYLAVIQLLILNYPSLIDPHAEWIAFAGFTLVSCAYIVVAFEMNSIRKYLRQKNKTLALAIEKIEIISITDDLTQVKNRRYILDALEQQKHLGQRNEYVFSVCLLDVDFFKNINDHYGHLCGDAVLVYCCEKISRLMRKADYFGRFGGEEFLLILPLTHKEQAKQVAERIRQLIEDAQLDSTKPELKVTLSIGVVEYQKPETTESLLGRVDNALYAAKAGGRNQVVVL